MRTSVEALEGNLVKLSVEVDEAEFDKAVDAAFRKIARESRIPGFRPGKAPRRLLEARIGRDAVRQEALRESLPSYYAEALKQTEIDAIAAPEIDITGGEEEGGLAFDAVVQVRPQLSVPGYTGLRVSVPNPTVSEADVDAQIDRLRGQFAQLNPVDRPASDGDHVTIDISGTRDGELVEGSSADDFVYEVGSGRVVAEMDDQLRGARTGDILQFEADVPDDGPSVTFRVLVKDVKEKVLPDADDEWASEASEFESVDELRDDLRTRLESVKRMQAEMSLRDEVVKALVELVEEDAPEPLVAEEMQRRANDVVHGLQERNIVLGDYLNATGQTEESFVEELRAAATSAVKADLALRAVAEAEQIEVDEGDVDAEIARLAERFQQKPDRLRRQLERADQMPAVRSDLRRARALDWLLEHVDIVDEEGRVIDRGDLMPPSGPDGDA